jgi:hypothetical protein
LSPRCDVFKNHFSDCRHAATSSKIIFQIVATLRCLQKSFSELSPRCDIFKNHFLNCRHAATSLNTSCVTIKLYQYENN